jgi:D-alanine-D-alanine ligase-like ATP-grasp enzyme
MVEVQALLAIEACGLDFGAVDIIFNERKQTAFVLEVNTAPGLTGQTVAGYVERFKEIL